MNRVHIGQRGVVAEVTTLIDWSKMAEAVATTDSQGQAEFFEHLAIVLDGARMGPGTWAMQCRAIAEEPGWAPLNRTRIAAQLETLAEHMRETSKLVDEGSAVADLTLCTSRDCTIRHTCLRATSAPSQRQSWADFFDSTTAWCGGFIRSN